jgi:C-terminal processing protease CtpA/Prc
VEFCNQVVSSLTTSFGSEVRITIRPNSNGQAEKMVKVVKTRIKTEMLSQGKFDS